MVRRALGSRPTLVKDVKARGARLPQALYENHAPEFIYYQDPLPYLREVPGRRGQDRRRPGPTSLFETDIWKALFAFQKDGVKGAINKILRHNGCIIADSVGLGKTYEALAVIKYFELKNERVLVLCPKKLRDNWTVYTANSLLNPFVYDRFRYRCPFPHGPQPRNGPFRRHRSGDAQLGQLRPSRHRRIAQFPQQHARQAR